TPFPYPTLFRSYQVPQHKSTSALCYIGDLEFPMPVVILIKIGIGVVHDVKSFVTPYRYRKFNWFSMLGSLHNETAHDLNRGLKIINLRTDNGNPFPDGMFP